MTGHPGCNFLKSRDSDDANAVVAAIGYNFRFILRWLRALLGKILAATLAPLITQSVTQPAS